MLKGLDDTPYKSISEKVNNENSHHSKTIQDLQKLPIIQNNPKLKKILKPSHS